MTGSTGQVRAQRLFSLPRFPRLTPRRSPLPPLRPSLRLSLRLCLGFLLPLACSSPSSKKGPPGAPLVPVTATVAETRDVPVQLKTIGSVEASNTVNVRARVGGELVRVAFQEGTHVQEGQLLFLVDPRPFEVALQSAVADSARDTAKTASAVALQQRYADLLQKDYVTKQEYDQAVADAKSLLATVQGDAAACANARLNLSFCYIRAPISGRTGNALVRQGNLISANDPNPLVVIQRITPVYVDFSLPESYLTDIRRHAAEAP